MATYTNTFAGGVNAGASWGDRWVVRFGGTWAFNDLWSFSMSFQSVPYVLGAGQVTTNGTPSFCFTYKERVYLANHQVFNFCDNDNPNEWEQQGPGSGFVEYLSQLGGQDSVVTFGQLQGRLAVLAGQSIQMWQVDANPANFALIQQLNNTGTLAPLSTQNQGDFDTMFLDSTGDRSLRASQVTLNAFIDDTGSPIDALILALMSSANTPLAASVIDPTTKNYWLHLGGTIFVHTSRPNSKISAWSTYTPTGSDGVLFAPVKFISYNGKVFCRGTVAGTDYLYTYGGSTGLVYDNQAPVKVQIPWLDDKRPAIEKKACGIDLNLTGKWKVYASMNPQNNGGVPNDVVYESGSASTPSNLTDSSYDIGRIDYTQMGTHFSIYAVSESTSTTKPVKFSAVALHYNMAGIS